MANRLETFYQHLITTYLNQFLNKYVSVDQPSVGYQLVGFIINLKTIQPTTEGWIYDVSVECRTQFNRTNAGYNRTFNKTFISPNNNLFNEDASQSDYDLIENTVQLIVTDITNAIINPSFQPPLMVNFPPENFKVINKKK